jgi:hypothetical protein
VREAGVRRRAPRLVLLTTLLTIPLLFLAACGGGASTSSDASDSGAGSAPTEPPSSDAPGPAETASIDPEVAAAAAELAAAAQAAATAVPPAAAIPPRDVPVLGGDISWPQCPKGMGIPHKRTLGLPLPRDDAEYVIIGLTNGPGFHVNPCLQSQVDWARARNLLVAAYAVASYPDDATLAAYGAKGPFDADTRVGRLQNAGYQQARFNVASLERTGLQTPIVWIDVESVPYYDWSGSVSDNAAVVQGVARGYLDAGLSIGVYSTPYLWAGVVGDLALGVPEWRAAGQTSMAEALSRCGEDWSIQGGQAVLGQWVEGNRDRNVTCLGAELELGAWFAQT